MPISNKRKWIYIAVSIFLAFIVWFFVNNTNTVSMNISDIPVEFLNEDRGLSSKGLVLVSGDDATIDLVLTMPRSMVYSFDPDNMRILADLSTISSTGRQTLTWTPVYPSNVNSTRVSIKSPMLRTVDIVVGDMFRRQVDVRCDVEGIPAQGFVAAVPQLLPSVLEIRGQQTDIMSVSYAKVTIDISGADTTLMQQLAVELYDENDALVTNRHIHPASDTIQVTLPIIPAHEIPLTVAFLESPGVRAASFDYSLDHDSILLSGDESRLAALDEISLGEVDLAAVPADGEEIVLDLELPDDVQNLSGFSSVTLTIRPTLLASKTLTARTMEIGRYEGSLAAYILPDSLAVTLCGTRADLDAVAGSDLRVIADLSEVPEASGTYIVPALIELVSDADVGIVGDYELRVRLEDIGLQESSQEGQ